MAATRTFATPNGDDAVENARRALDAIKPAFMADFNKAYEEMKAELNKQFKAALAAKDTGRADAIKAKADELAALEAAIKAATSPEKAAEIIARAKALLDEPKATTPTSANADWDKWREGVDKRLDGHDNRHKEAESNLKELNGAVGIIKNPDGVWVPSSNGQFAANTAVQNHLGYNRDKDGKVSFTDRGSFSTNAFMWALKIFAVLLGLTTAIYLIAGFFLGYTYSLTFLIVGAIVSVVGFVLAYVIMANRTPQEGMTTHQTTNDN